MKADLEVFDFHLEPEKIEEIEPVAAGWKFPREIGDQVNQTHPTKLLRFS